jgi:hypothetical protein
MRSLVIAVLFAAAACTPAPSRAYAPAVEENFMRACEAASTVPGLCACTWARIEAEVPPADFAALEALPGPQRQAHALARQIESYALACNPELSDGEPVQ